MIALFMYTIMSRLKLKTTLAWYQMDYPISVIWLLYESMEAMRINDLNFDSMYEEHSVRKIKTI